MVLVLVTVPAKTTEIVLGWSIANALIAMGAVIDATIKGHWTNAIGASAIIQTFLITFKIGVSMKTHFFANKSGRLQWIDV